jgi:hypothetical protein
MAVGAALHVPFDPRAHAMIGVILLSAAALASWLPARRAIR